MAKSRARKLADIIVGAGIDIDGNLTFDGGSTSADLTFADNDKANFGDASDLQIYHDGSNSYIKDAGTGDLIVEGSNNIWLMKAGGSEVFLNTYDDGAVQLYHDNSVKLATFSGGVSVTGQLNATTMHLPDGSTGLQLGASNDTKFFHDGSNSKITHSGSGGFYIGADTLGLQTGAHNENYLTAAVNGAVSLYYDNSAKLATASTGIDVTGSIDVTSSASYGVTANRGFKSTADIPNFTLVESDASGQTWQINSTGAKLSFRDISRQLDRIVIDTAGNVGIGTSSPDAKLSVTSSTINSEDILYLKSGADNVNDYLGIAWELGVGGNGPHSAIRSFAGPSGSDARLGFLTTSDGGTTLTEGLSIAHNGNVGIGTTTPAQPLQIYNGGGYWASVSRGNSTAGGSDPWLGLFNNINIANATYGWGFYDSSADGSLQIWNKTNSTTGYNTFTIKRGGDIGIGTTDPNAKLHINQTSQGNFTEALRIENSGGGANEGNYIQWEVANTSGYGPRIGGRREGTGGVGLHFYTGEINAAPTEAMRIEHDGNVEVRDGASLRAYRPGNSAYAGLFMDSGEKLFIRNSWGVKDIVMLRTGEVGIGTDNPAVPLHVYNASQGRVAIENASRRFDLAVDADGLSFRDQSAAVTRMVLDTSGNLTLNG